MDKNMDRIKLNDFFYLDELVDHRTYFTAKDNGLSEIDPKLINLLFHLRKDYGKSMTINNWWDYYLSIDHEPNFVYLIENNDSVRKYSGLRGSKCTVGAKFSAHRKGNGADIKGNPKELFKLIRENSKKYYDLGLRRLEDVSITPTWIHLDTWDKNNVKAIQVVDLKKVVENIILK